MTTALPEVRVEADRLPTALFEHAQDWTDLLATRQLAEPLFYETPNVTMQSRLLGSCERLSDHAWRLTVNPQAQWSDGTHLNAQQVITALQRAREAGAGGLLPSLMLASVKRESAREILVRTRYPLAHLERVLANPALAPHSDKTGITLGRYRRVSQNDTSLCWLATNGTHRLRWFPQPTGGADLATAEVVGPMSRAPQDWAPDVLTSHAQVAPLHFVCALRRPQGLSNRAWQSVNDLLSDRQLCQRTRGLVLPASTLSSPWTALPPAPFEGVRNRSTTDLYRPVYYARFAGNRDLATGVSHTLRTPGTDPYPILEYDYGESLARTIPTAGYQLVIISAPWPHPAAMLAPYLFGPTTADGLRADILAALAEPDLTRAAMMVHNAETRWNIVRQDILVLGRVVGSVASQAARVWLPPSGWMDYSQAWEEAASCDSNT